MSYDKYILLLIGLSLIILNVIRDNTPCPPTRVEYRYIPRSFKDEQQNPVKVTQLFSSMFTSAPFTDGMLRSDVVQPELVYSEDPRVGIKVRSLYGDSSTSTSSTS